MNEQPAIGLGLGTAIAALISGTAQPDTESPAQPEAGAPAG
jgi:hypothetical protein